MKTFNLVLASTKQAYIARILHHNESHPPQGLSEARRAREVFLKFYSLIRRGGAPSGVAAFIATEQVEIPLIV
jgi:hypothetical protein